MERKCDDFIDTYLKYVENTESPLSYHIWVALATIGAANGQNLMHRDTNFTMSNNLFILLIAKQGKTRKTTAIDIGIDLLEEVEQITISPESISKEALFKDMAESQNELHKESNYVIYAGELSSIINTSGIDTVNFFIRVFDKVKTLRNSTLGRGQEEIKKPHITLMAATTPAQMRTGFGIDMRDNGMMSRTALIYETHPRQRLALGGKKDKELKKMLIHDLKVIAMQRPRQQIAFTPTADKFYKHWYEEVLKAEEDLPVSPLEEAFISRKDLFMLKISTICCISRNGFEINLDDMNRALSIIEPMQAGLGEVNGLLGTDKNLHIKEGVLKMIKQRGKIQASVLSAAFFHDITRPEWVDVLNHIQDSGFVRVEAGAIYVWNGD